MSQRDRSVVTCSLLAVLGKTEELKVHLGRAVDNGVTVDELRGLIVLNAGGTRRKRNQRGRRVPSWLI